MNDLATRLFNFSVKTLKLTSKLPDTPEFKVIRYQLAKSVTSCGANYEEAQSGSTKADFAHKIRITLREMRESNFWLRTIQSISIELKNSDNLKDLIDESNQLRKILATILNKMTNH